MAGIAKSRLAEERRAWRKDHPIGFFARPETSADGSVNLMRWKCGVPGKEKGLWAGGLYDITMEFTEDYPHTPPKCKFPAGFFHPNVYPSGTVCLSILNAEEAWKPGITLKQILLGIQDLLDTPNPQSPAQQNAYHTYTTDRVAYDKRVKEQVAQNRPDRYE